jgi:hypothetical protein
MRSSTTSIVISHVRNTWRKSTYVNPTIKEGSYHFTWGLWQNYYLKELGAKLLPCHYFAELVDKDYVIYRGCAECQQSWYMRELAEAKMIPYQYRDAILILVGEDFSLEIMEERLSDHLCDKVISDIMKGTFLDINRIFKLDDILVTGWEEAAKLAGINYDITMQRYFDIRNLRINLGRFTK